MLLKITFHGLIFESHFSFLQFALALLHILLKNYSNKSGFLCHDDYLEKIFFCNFQLYIVCPNIFTIFTDPQVARLIDLAG